MIDFVSTAKGPIGEWIWNNYVERIKEGHISQAEFARKLGINEQLFNNYINGKRRPEGENVEKLAKLGTEIYDLLGLRRPDPLLDKLIEAYDAASPEEKEEIIRQAFHLIGFEPEEK